MNRIEKIESRIANMQEQLFYLEDVVETTPPPIPMFNQVKRWKLQHVNRRYYDTAMRVTDQWEHKDEPCDCKTSKTERVHNKIRFFNNEKWYVICPIRYYLLLGWKSVTEGLPTPPVELYNKLLQIENGAQ